MTVSIRQAGRMGCRSHHKPQRYRWQRVKSARILTSETRTRKQKSPRARPSTHDEEQGVGPLASGAWLPVRVAWVRRLAERRPAVAWRSGGRSFGIRLAERRPELRVLAERRPAEAWRSGGRSFGIRLAERRSELRVLAERRPAVAWRSGGRSFGIRLAEQRPELQDLPGRAAAEASGTWPPRRRARQGERRPEEERLERGARQGERRRGNYAWQGSAGFGTLGWECV
ncbi:hypothetical protein PVAP13_1NG163200 [Panicum virgatum]|uniref:Uncharacterized protein n=1 Tax=Panicum virgatum TaxID=38727 RepID=A0A8T0WND2_PANVG|nr:hypothetical protein PVAP13_1NG163200 [Panicum virgatum]